MRNLIALAVAAIFSIGGVNAFAADSSKTESTAAKSKSTTSKKAPAKKSTTSKKAKPKATTPEAAPKPTPATPIATPQPAPAAPAKTYPAKFKGAFGKVVERRTYPTEEMKNRAVNMWDREGKILEPDGTITVPAHALKKEDAPGVPGH